MWEKYFPYALYINYIMQSQFIRIEVTFNSLPELTQLKWNLPQPTCHLISNPLRNIQTAVSEIVFIEEKKTNIIQVADRYI